VSAALAAAVLPAVAAASSGLDSCPCIDDIFAHPDLTDINQYRQGSSLVYKPPGSSSSYYYPLTYGRSCVPHDVQLPPVCTRDSAPRWCQESWCFVDAENCEGTVKSPTKYFPAVEKLYFSYGTCVASGSSNSYTEWTAEDIEGTRKLIGLLEGYTRSARFEIEEIFKTYTATSSANCSIDTLCPCEPDCVYSHDWKAEMNFWTVGWLEGPDGNDSEKARAQCLAAGIAGNYHGVVAKEADSDFARVGYLYFGEQATGAYAQWPQEDACTWGLDPRFRPWYAAAATGPKDVIIVVDVSGSMLTNNRHVMSQKAVEAILDTLTWKDFATIILFNNFVSAVYKDVLVPVTDSERDAMKQFCKNQQWAAGGTNFKSPLRKVFDILHTSIFGGHTSMCQKAVMFLTDGQAAFEDSDFEFVKRKSIEYDVFFFTYALGEKADATVVKRLACENRGVFYPVADGSDLAKVMSSYFEYFAHGQEMCSSSFVKYTAFGPGHVLYAGCMPMYDRTSPSPELLGVTCMDINMVEDISVMKQEAGWKHLMCVASDMTKMCRHVDLQECQRQKIRLSVSKESVCTDASHDFRGVEADTVCPCIDQGCVDNLDFRDEKQYFCDAWVGDNCTHTDPLWGYSEEGLKEVQENCKRSCGLCGWSEGACSRTSSDECPVLPVPSECRACLGKVSGYDLEGVPMSCPPDAPRDLMSTKAPTTVRRTTSEPTASASMCQALPCGFVLRLLAVFAAAVMASTGQ